MGLFSSKKKTYVSSVVYNMAGDVRDRADYAKTLASGHSLSEENGRTYTSELLDSYLAGPGINLRRFGRWARTYGYNGNVGAVNSSASVLGSVNTTALAAAMAPMFPVPIYINEAEVGVTDYGMWASQYILANYREKYTQAWAADFDEASGEIIINFPGMSPIRFVPAGFVQFAQYLYVSLNQEREAISSSSMSEWQTGRVPSTSGYTQGPVTSVPAEVNLMSTTTVTQTITGQEPTVQVIETPTTQTISLNSSVWTKTEVLPDPVHELVVGDVTRSISVRESYEVVDTTVTDTLVEDDRTTTVVRVNQTIRKITEHQTGVVTVREKAWENEQIYIYRRGSGNAALDALFSGATSAGTFFPIIPVRVENQFISESYLPHLYPWVKKAVRRATNTSFEGLVKLVADNPNLGDLDFAYVVFGTSLNTPEHTARRYIYELFRNVSVFDSGAGMANFWAQYNAAVASWDAWTLWYTSGRYTEQNEWGWSEPVPEPVRLPMPSLPSHSIQITSAQNYNIVISYSGVTETVHSGQFQPGAKINDVRIIKGDSQTLRRYPEQISDEYDGGFRGNINLYNALAQFSAYGATNLQTIHIDWQTNANTFRRLTIINPVHTNHVYGGKSVVITGWEALDDPEESGFIIPLQDETLRRMPIPVATQLCTASTYMMFNCYQIVKQKWYQTGLFQVIILIVIIVIAVFSGGASAATSGGLLGSNAAVGTAIGFSGTAAIVAGAIANAIVGMIVSKIISKLSVAVFGDKIGGIIGAIASVVAISVGSSMAGGQPISVSFGNMMTAENLFKLTSSLVDGMSNYIAASTAEIQAQAGEVLSDYQKQAKELSEKFMNEFGSTGVIDPLQAAGVFTFNKLEDPASFLNRTLMTGTDIADLSHSMLDNFTNLTTSLPLE